MEAQDEHTQVFSKGAFEPALRNAVGEAARDRQPLSLIIGDIDHFKQVNDTRGHQAGDAVLRQVARRLEQVVQGKGRVYRIGGEEFGLILRNYSAEEALATAERARRGIEVEAVDGIPVSMSFGVACFPEDASDEAGLIGAADKAMYDAKDRGRNLVRRFGEAPPPKPGPREPERKRPQHGRLTDRQRTDLRRRYLQGERIHCPEDGSLLAVHDVTTSDHIASGREFAITCPGCGLAEQLQDG